MAAWAALMPLDGGRAAEPARSACEAERFVELPVAMAGRRPVIRAKVNGVEQLFLADSGAILSMISPAAAARLDMELRPAPKGLSMGGLGGSFAVLACYVAIILISLRIASLAHSHFGRIAASGMTAFFALFVLINGAMIMGLAPVVGVPMPLLSYGGSSMMTIMFGFGLILSTRVHRYAELPKGHGLF